MGSKSLRDLVPGDPREIWLLADSYNRMARLCEDVGRGFCAVDDGGWRGRAAEAFQTRFEQQPKRLRAMADSYGHVAVALDTYASALSWAQRQAGEVVALDDEEDPQTTPPPEASALTAAQQAELTGVITGTDAPAPEPVRVDQRALALSNYRRALAMLDTVGNESADAITIATELIPAPVSALPTVTTTPPPAPPDLLATSGADLVVHAVLPAPTPQTWFAPSTLRDDPHAWAAAITKIRKRLRWDGLNRLSPRLAQHIFEGHYRPGKDTGYHHREGGIDRGVLRVVEIIDGPDMHGVYVAEVRGPRTPPGVTKKSTFFPDSWSRAEVLHAVRHVFLDAMRNRGENYDPDKCRFRGVYRDVLIQGHLKRGSTEPRLCDIVTAYPRRVRRQRNRS